MTLPNHVTRDTSGALRCSLHGSSRCQHIRDARKAGHPFRSIPDPTLDPVDSLPDDPTTWTSDQLHTFNISRRDRIDNDDYQRD